jgi:SWI/SNF-related matrix-associated actin-dependent regulator 1 of chromatin subfamily A
MIGQLQNFGGYKYFMDRYCQGGTGAANLNELNGKLNNICFFRREKQDVLKDLPDKMREVFTCDITTRAEYNMAKGDLGKFLRESGYSDKQVNKSLNAEIMVKIGVLKSISARGKLPEAIEHIQEVVDAGEKIVVFIHQKFMAEALMKEFPEAVTVRGDDDREARQRNVDAFQNDPSVQVIICSIKAAGVGITLTASSRLMFLELPWHAADVEQCEDRIHRIGQKNSAQISYFLGKDTIDEYIYKLIEAKRGVADAITGTTTDISTIITDITKNLFNQK